MKLISGLLVSAWAMPNEMYVAIHRSCGDLRVICLARKYVEYQENTEYEAIRVTNWPFLGMKELWGSDEANRVRGSWARMWTGYKGQTTDTRGKVLCLTRSFCDQSLSPLRYPPSTF